MPTEKDNSRQDWTPESILNAGRSFWEARPLLAAAELDLFPLLAKKPMTADAVATAARTDYRGTRMLLDALAAMEVLIKEGEEYRVPPSLIPALSDDSAETVLPMLKHQSAVFRRWADLPAVVRTGQPPRREREERDPEEMRAFIGGMHVLGKKVAEDIVARVNPERSRRLLDFGGASGTYTIAFLRKVPQMKATLFDLPEVVELARETLREEGLLDRVTLVAGDFYVNSLPKGHDLVFLSAIIHQNSREQNRDLFAKSFDALVPGGRIVIRDHVMDPSRTRPRAGALFAINMLVGTAGGGTYTFDEIREDLEFAGFGKVRLITEDKRMNGLVEATR